MKYVFGFLVAILLPVVVHAEFDKGMAAYQRGDYATAYRELLTPAQQGYAKAQFILGVMYDNGKGVPRDDKEAVKWYRLAAEQGVAYAQFNLGSMYTKGEGVPQDYILAHYWFNLAVAQGLEKARNALDLVTGQMTPAQLAQAQQLASDEQQRKREQFTSGFHAQEQTPQVRQAEIAASGTGIVVSSEGHVVTNHHVITECVEIRIPPSKTAVPVVADDAANDLALLISDDFKTPASFRDGRGIQQGEDITVIGFPLHGLLASGPKVTTGNVSALAGPSNDTRLLQITAPVQPGNSGGPLLDTGGHVVGIVESKINAIKLAQLTGDIPQNINFAINAAVVRNFLDANSIAYVTAPPGKPLSTADITQQARHFTVLVECWK